MDRSLRGTLNCDRYPDSVAYAEQAVEHARTTNNPNLGARLNTLSNQLSTWIERFGGPRDRYPDSVAYAEQAVEHARTTNNPNLGARLNTLSNRLSTWIERFGGPRDRYRAFANEVMGYVDRRVAAWCRRPRRSNRSLMTFHRWRRDSLPGSCKPAISPVPLRLSNGCAVYGSVRSARSRRSHRTSLGFEPRARG